VRSLSLRRRRRLGGWIGGLIYNNAKKARTRSQANIKRAMPHLSEQHVDELGLKAYRCIVAGVLDCFCLSSLPVEFVLSPQAEKTLSSDKGAVVATLHMSCYELVPYFVQRYATTSTTLSKIPPFLTFAQKVYSEAGIQCVNKNEKGAIFKLIKAALAGHVVTLHGDHYASEVPVSFFSQATSAPAGVAMLSAVADKPILIGYGLWREDRYQIVIESFAHKSRDKTPEAYRQVTQAIYDRFEQIILANPEQWYWSYNRWRKEV